MTPAEVLEVWQEHKTAQNRMARRFVKEAMEQKVDVPGLIGAMVNEYACTCENRVEYDMEQYL